MPPIIAEDRSWHVVRTLPRWADRACVALEKLDIVAVLPRWSEIRVRRNRPIVHKAALLPRSIFVGVRDQEHLAEACAVYSVVEPVRINGQVASIPPDEMRRFLHSLTRGEVEEPMGIKIGDRVAVLEGPFASFPGVIEEMIPEGVRVAVAIFGRASPITLGLAQVERMN